jgi:membrane dipeptidase
MVFPSEETSMLARQPHHFSRREIVQAFAATTMGAPAFLRRRYSILTQDPKQYSARAIRLVQEATVLDMLNQFRFADFSEDPPRSRRWLTVPASFTAEDYEAYRTSGINVFALGHGAGSYDEAVKYFADWNGFLAGYDEWLLRIDDANDFERVRSNGKVGILLTFQDSKHFRHVNDVNTFFGLGQRVSQLTYNFANRLGSGFLEQRDGGLTVFGGSILERMNEVGMGVDISHCADVTTLDVLAAAQKPVLFTHAGCRALLPDHMRNKTDEMIRKMAATGGVMGIAMLRFLVRDMEPVDVEHVLDHFDHVVGLVGVEHVGIGSDMDLIGNPNPVGGDRDPSQQPNFERYKVHADPEGSITIRGLDHARRVFDLTEGLIRRGYNDNDIKLMLGGNFVRVLSEIWST